MIKLYRCFLVASLMIFLSASVFASDDILLIGEWKVSDAKLDGKPSDVCSYCDLFLNKTSIFFKQDGFVRYDKTDTEVKYTLQNGILTFSKSNGEKITHTLVFQTNLSFKLYYTVNNTEEVYLFTKIK